MDSSILSQLEYKPYNLTCRVKEYFIIRDDNSDIKYFTSLIEIPIGYICDDFCSFINLNVVFNRFYHVDNYESHKKFKICGAYITDLKSFKIKGVTDPTKKFNNFKFPQFIESNPLIRCCNDYLFVSVKFKCELSELYTQDIFEICLTGYYCEISKDICYCMNFSNQLEYFEGYIEMNYNEPIEYEFIIDTYRPYYLDIFREFYLHDINFFMMNSDSEIIESLDNVVEMRLFNNYICSESFTEDNMLRINATMDVPNIYLRNIMPTDCFFLVKFTAKKFDLD